jgi:DNA-binding response OmpR family regulator
MSSSEIPFPYADEVSPPETKYVRPLQLSASGARPHVLLADGDPLCCLEFFQTLTEAGYHVTVAVNGMDALLELRKSDHPGVALLADDLGGMNASDICNLMRGVGKRIYFILYGNVTPADPVAHAAASGADIYVPKDLLRGQLAAHVQEGLLRVGSGSDVPPSSAGEGEPGRPFGGPI